MTLEVLFKEEELNTFAAVAQTMVFLVNGVPLTLAAVVGRLPLVGHADAPVKLFRYSCACRLVIPHMVANRKK